LQLPTRLLKTMTHRLARTAHDSLNVLGFDTQQLLMLQDEQSYAEANNGNPLAPSMQSSATIFSMTANLANQPHNQPALATVGANYGAYLYLLDAVKDYAEDYHSGEYNPLSGYAHATPDVLTLTQDGVEWLKAEFTEILQNIQTGLASIQLYHYEQTLQTMMTEPIQRMVNRLNQVTDGIHYAQITQGDIWKSLLLMSEDKPKGESVDDFFSDEKGADHPTKEKSRKPKKRRDNGGCCDDAGDDVTDSACSCLWFSSDMIRCIDLDCDGIPDCMDSDGGCGDGCGGCDIGGCDGMDCGGGDCS